MAAVIGDPVDHSLSPALHNAAFSALGLDWIYVALPVARGDGAAAVAAMRTLGLAGMSVTMPHKADVINGIDHLGPTAAQLGVVNTISWTPSADGGELSGDSTDGAGFLDSLRGDDGFDPKGEDCVVLGSGGAARAVVLALADAGASSITVAGQDAKRCRACADLAGPAGRTSDAAGSELADAVAGARLIVNATPVGMAEGDGLPFGIPEDSLNQDHFVADLIYAPALTPLLQTARRRGAAGTNGMGMLVHQAARQFEIWTGRPAPLSEMSVAALSTLARSSR